jgi:hypothetical protein
MNSATVKKQYIMLSGLILGLLALIFFAPNLFNGLFPGGLVKAPSNSQPGQNSPRHQPPQEVPGCYVCQ